MQDALITASLRHDHHVSFSYYVSAKKDENDHWTYFARDPVTHLVTRIDYPDGTYETFTYDEDNPGRGFGQVSSHRMTSGGVERFVYDARGLKTEYIPPATDSDPNPWDHPTRYYYYSNNAAYKNDRLAYTIDPRGNYTWYDYNGRGQVTRTTHMDGSYIQNSYNAWTGTLASTTDELGHTTSYTYDEYKRVLTTTNPLYQTSSRYYGQDWANPLAHTTNNPKATYLPSGRATHYSYDPNWHTTIKREAPGTADDAWTYYGYDTVGNLYWKQDPRGNVTCWDYDSRNRLAYETPPDSGYRGNPAWATFHYYDGVGNKTREVRPGGSFRTWDYDEMNRLWHAYDWRTNETPSAQQTISYLHEDAAHNLTGIIDEKGAPYNYGYDMIGRKTYSIYPTDATGAQRNEFWTYDEAGNLKWYMNPTGKWKHFDYDYRNRQYHAYWADTWATTTPNWNVGQEVSTGYDNASRIGQIQTNGGETTVGFAYDDANHKIDEWQTVGGSATHHLHYDYNDDGLRQHMGTDVQNAGYRYNQRNQLATLGDDTNRQPGNPDNGYFAWLTFSYDAAGSLIRRHTWTGSDQVYDHDDRNRIKMVESDWPSGAFARSWYQYDAIGREAQTWRDEDGGKGEQFSYTVRDQLQNVFYNAQNVANGGTPSNWSRQVTYNYSPDLLNRYNVNDNGNVTTYSPDSMNQYVNVNGSMGYDGNFNLTYYQAWGGWSYGYDANNHLTSGGSTGAPNRIGFTYDGLGRCLKRTIDGVTNLYVYDNWSVVAEFDRGNNFISWNAFGPSGPDDIQMRVSNNWGIQFYHKDAHGSVMYITDTGTGIWEQYRYDAFGQPVISDWGGANVRGASNSSNRFMFTGREYFAQMGIYDYRNRWYHPALGRFLQSDPTGFDAGDDSLFRFVGDDPIDKTDPTGMFAIVDVTADGGVRGSVPGSMMGSENPAAKAYHAEVANALKSFKQAMNASHSGGGNVTWGAHYQERWGEPGRDFGRKTATTEWETESTATASNDGRISHFSEDLKITTHWNESAKAAEIERAQSTDSNKGEIGHVRDATFYGTHGSVAGLQSAQAIADTAARSMVGQRILVEEAARRMQTTLSDWVRTTQERSHDRYDHLGQHIY